MPYVTWSARYSVGAADIDAEHQKLFGMVNELHDAMVARKGNEVMGKTLNGLASYTTYHFGHEERLMAKTRYPDYDAHRAQHQSLLKQVERLITSFDNGEPVMSVEVMNFLSKWLTGHIEMWDMKLGTWTKEQGLSGAGALATV